MGILLKPKPAKKTRMTVREYFALPTEAPYETLLIYGELITMPRPKPKHNDFLHDLAELIKRHGINRRRSLRLVRQGTNLHQLSRHRMGRSGA